MVRLRLRSILIADRQYGERLRIEVSGPRPVCWMIDGRGDGLHEASRTTFEDFVSLNIPLIGSDSRKSI